MSDIHALSQKPYYYSLPLDQVPVGTRIRLADGSSAIIDEQDEAGQRVWAIGCGDSELFCRGERIALVHSSASAFVLPPVAVEHLMRYLQSVQESPQIFDGLALAQEMPMVVRLCCSDEPEIRKLAEACLFRWRCVRWIDWYYATRDLPIEAEAVPADQISIRIEKLQGILQRLPDLPPPDVADLLPTMIRLCRSDVPGMHEVTEHLILQWRSIDWIKEAAAEDVS